MLRTTSVPTQIGWDPAKEAGMPRYSTITGARGSEKALPFCTQAYRLNTRVLAVHPAPGLNYKAENSCIISAVLYLLSKCLHQVQGKPKATCTGWYNTQWEKVSLQK